MRITLDDEKALKLVAILSSSKFFTTEEYKIIEELCDKITSEYMKPTSSKKTEAAERATIIRQVRVKEKIRNAVNLLHLENAKINTNSVAKKAGVSYNTVKKYSYLIYQID